MQRRPIIGVIGGGKNQVAANSATYAHAKRVGELVAKGGAILLCGGGGGVMEAAARGAKDAKPPGKTIGIIPKAEGERQANQYIDCAIYTGLRDARNYINAVTSDALIALQGGPGTLSEIALGLKTGTPVVYLSHWEFLNSRERFKGSYVTTPEDAVRKAFELVCVDSNGLLDRALEFPQFPDQTRQREQLFEFVEVT